jgi:uncharacterized membrane protein (UPF0127 family)
MIVSVGLFRPGTLVRALVAGLALFLLAACGELPENQARLHTATGDYLFNIEIADTPEARNKGLMFRDSLASDAGMLFDFHEERQAAFWMQNTFIPLDIIFISADGTVRTVHANARPMDTTGIPSQVPVQFVLEIPGGRAAQIGLMAGDKFEHSRVGTLAATPSPQTAPATAQP